jgi:hypothetical protein
MDRAGSRFIPLPEEAQNMVDLRGSRMAIEPILVFLLPSAAALISPEPASASRSRRERRSPDYVNFAVGVLAVSKQHDAAQDRLRRP